MAKVRNVSSDDRFAVELGRWVKVDETVDVPDDRADAYTSQVGVWAEATPVATSKSAAATVKES